MNFVSDKPFDQELEELFKKDKVIPTVMAGREQHNKVTSIMAPPPIKMADTVMTKVPASVKQPIEIKIQATDTNGSKAETQLKINPVPEKRGFVGKKSLAAQIDQAIRLRA